MFHAFLALITKDVLCLCDNVLLFAGVFCLWDRMHQARRTIGNAEACCTLARTQVLPFIGLLPRFPERRTQSMVTLLADEVPNPVSQAQCLSCAAATPCLSLQFAGSAWFLRHRLSFFFSEVSPNGQRMNRELLWICRLPAYSIPFAFRVSLDNVPQHSSICEHRPRKTVKP